MNFQYTAPKTTPANPPMSKPRNVSQIMVPSISLPIVRNEATLRQMGGKIKKVSSYGI